MNQYGRAVWLKTFLVWDMALLPPPLWWVWCRTFVPIIAWLFNVASRAR